MLSPNSIMNSNLQPLAALFGSLALCAYPNNVMSQTNQNDAARWLAGASIAPPFVAPVSTPAWERKRKQTRAQLWEVLGKLPPRPMTSKIESPSREDRGDYVLEKFQFDNGAGATVPGYLLLPANLQGKAPALLYCHWHGGQYEIGKEELFQTSHTPEPPCPAFARSEERR